MTLQSPCCGAAVRTQEARLDRGAWWYVCISCGKPCDPVEGNAPTVPSAPGKAVEGE